MHLFRKTVQHLIGQKSAPACAARLSLIGSLVRATATRWRRWHSPRPNEIGRPAELVLCGFFGCLIGGKAEHHAEAGPLQVAIVSAVAR